ncbi:MAG: glycosyltransferase family 4 protein [Vicinamibacterales bacterium]
MRVLIDYRAALRERSGVGEYTHQLVRALLARHTTGDGEPVEVTVFSSSRRDRLGDDPELAAARKVDRHIPVALLNLAWHRLGWPDAEGLSGGRFDIAHSLHPLLMPARQAAQVVTIHDLNFLLHPERTRAEIRRDYPSLARTHAHRADQVVVVSEFTRGEVQRLLDVDPDRITVCSPGGPSWARRTGVEGPGYLLFFGTLEPRKNIGTLLDAYALLLEGGGPVPELVLAGKATEQSGPWLDRIGRAPLRGRVRHLGYIAPGARERLYAGARLLIQPSFEEGFGLPVLEAMTVGVPVVAADAGALPEVGGDAVQLCPPTEAEAMAGAIARLLADEPLARAAVERGFRQAARYNWDRTAEDTVAAYRNALRYRARARGAA